MAELLTFVLGDVFGILTLMVGIVVGFFIGRAWASFTSRRQESQLELEVKENEDGKSTVYREQLAGMIQFTNHFSGDLTKHIELLESLGQQLNHPADDSTKDVEEQSTKAVELVAEIAAANHRLKRRLESAEANLKTQAQELEESLSEARTDVLTRLLNRRAFDEEQNRRWAHWQRKEQPYSVMILDIDHFKQVNDKYGHDAGDKVLKETASRLMSVMRETDYLARIGGEEMAILLPEGDWDSIASVACKVLDVVRCLPIIYGECEIYVTVSCGLMSVEHANSIASLMKGADEALYAAKSNGRNCGYINDGATFIPINDLAARRSEKLEEVPREQSKKPASDSPETNTNLPASGIDLVANELRNRLFQVSQKT